jgi:hypothetical protein
MTINWNAIQYSIQYLLNFHPNSNFAIQEAKILNVKICTISYLKKFNFEYDIWIFDTNL